jgi:hypothetical protein
LVHLIEHSAAENSERRNVHTQETVAILKEETTPAEFNAMQLVWDIQESQSEMFKGKVEKLETLAKGLSDRIPFESETADMTWEILHSAMITAEVFLRMTKTGLSASIFPCL